MRQRGLCVRVLVRKFIQTLPRDDVHDSNARCVLHRQNRKAIPAQGGRSLRGEAGRSISSDMEIGQFIVKTLDTCGGRARLAGRRIPVSSVYRWFLSGFEPEDILEKYEGATLAEIYAAISYALANREEIAAQIEEEDRLEAGSRERQRQAPALSA